MTSMRMFAIGSTAILLLCVRVASAQTCSISKMNHSCTLTIDREYPVSPPTIQMYSGSTLTVRVKNPLPFENYSLDTVPGTATQNPDAFAAVLQGQGLLAAVPNFVYSQEAIPGAATAAKPPPDPCDDSRTALTKAEELYAKFSSKPPKKGKEAQKKPLKVTAAQVEAAFAQTASTFDLCTQSLLADARIAYVDIDPYLSRYLTAYTKEQTSTLPKNSMTTQLTSFATTNGDLRSYIEREATISSAISNIPGAIQNSSIGPDLAPDLFKLNSGQKLLDAIASDLFGYRQRFSDFVQSLQHIWSHDDDLCFILWPPAIIPPDPATGKPMTAESYCPTRPAPDPILLVAVPDTSEQYEDMALRSKVYTLNALNMVANQAEATTTATATNKVAIASITVQYGGNSHAITRPSSLRLDGSLGVLVSMIPIRSFSVQPAFTGTAVTNNLVHETTTSPQWVPFAAVNYRLLDHLPWKTRWQSGIYYTFGLGINPNTKTTDIATGISLSWREVMFGFLCHVTHDMRLTSGFYKGESLGPTFTGTLPTETYWTTTFALGISVRIPTVTGR